MLVVTGELQCAMHPDLQAVFGQHQNLDTRPAKSTARYDEETLARANYGFQTLATHVACS